MVRGLQLFSAWFEKYTDQFILIGGTAASLAMNAAGVEFRHTKDLDIVIHVDLSRFIVELKKLEYSEKNYSILTNRLRLTYGLE